MNVLSTVNRQSFVSLRRSLSTFDVLIISASIWFLGKFLRYVFPPLFELLQETYAVSTTTLGWTFSAFLFAYAVVQFPTGLFCDKFGTVWVITTGVVVSSIGALVLIADAPFVVFIVLMIVMGVGTGVHKTAAVQLLSKTYPAHKGRVLGIFDTFGTFGGVVAPVAVAVAASIPGTRPGWRVLLFGTGIVGLCFTAIFLIRVPDKVRANMNETVDQQISPAESEPGPPTEPTAEQVTADPDWRSYSQLFSSQRFSIFVIASVCFSFTYQGFVYFLPLYLIQEAGLTSATAGTLYSVLFIASISQVVAGEAGDRIGTLPVIIGALGLATVSTVIFILGTGAGVYVLGLATLSIGLGAHSFRPVRGAYLMESLPDNLSAGGFGIVRTLLMGSGAVAPGIVGTVSDAFGFRPAFWILAVSIGIATVLSISLLYWDV